MKSNLSRTLSVILVVLVAFSCQDDDVDSKFPFEAEVLQSSLDCKDFEIKITKGKQQAILITGVDSDGLYTAKNLPENLKIEGINIKLNIKQIKNTELTPCTTLGTPHPWIYVTEAEAF